MKCTDLLVHYAEIATKGKNRPQFIAMLERNLRQALRGLPIGTIRRPSGRIWLSARPGEAFDDEALTRLGTVYGVSSYSPVVRTEMDLSAIKEVGLALVRDRQYASFRVTSRRAFKELPYSSMEVNGEVGAHLLLHKPAAVKMKGAELELYIEMVPGAAYLYVDKYRGLGGLPMGMSGTVGALLSGGIDSPVAANRMQRRGLNVVLVHFHAHPLQSRASMEKALDLAALLARTQGRIVLYLVPFGELQRQVMLTVKPDLRVILYRRFMLRIAGALTSRHGARALVTGESIGQVASQTLANMVAINAAAPLPVLRPLVAFDKQEIVDEAKRLGSYDISVLPDEDCCSLFIPRHPETHARLEAVEADEAKLDGDALCADAIARAERHELCAPWLASDAPTPQRQP
ncbi:MAG: tRNA uracil 4-sulfurtransferase ThiI [Myxococcota bacterium]